MHQHHFAHVIHPIRPKDLFLFTEKKNVCERLKHRETEEKNNAKTRFFPSFLIHYKLRMLMLANGLLYNLIYGHRRYNTNALPKYSKSHVLKCVSLRWTQNQQQHQKKKTTEETAKIQWFLHVSTSHTRCKVLPEIGTLHCIPSHDIRNARTRRIVQCLTAEPIEITHFLCLSYSTNRSIQKSACWYFLG